MPLWERCSFLTEVTTEHTDDPASIKVANGSWPLYITFCSLARKGSTVTSIGECGRTTA